MHLSFQNFGHQCQREKKTLSEHPAVKLGRQKTFSKLGDLWSILKVDSAALCGDNHCQTLRSASLGLHGVIMRAGSILP